MVGRHRDRSGFGGQAGAATTAAVAVPEPSVACSAGRALVVPAAFNLAAWPLVVHPMDFVTRTLPYTLGVRNYFNSSIEGNGVYFGLPFWLILFLRILFTLLAIGSLWLLYRYYRTRDPLFWFATRRVCCCCGRGWCWHWPGLLLHDAVPVPDDGGVAQFGDSQLAGLAGRLRLPDDGQVAAAPLDVHRAAAGLPEDHLRLVAAADRGVRRALLPLLEAKAEHRLDNGIDGAWLRPRGRALAWRHDFLRATTMKSEAMRRSGA